MAQHINRSLGIQRNKLLRYKLIKDLYNKLIAEHPYTPITKIHLHYIFPIYPISRATLYQVLCTSVTTELRNVENAINTQTSLFN